MQAELNLTSPHKPVGILIVTRLIDQANEIAAKINDHAGRVVAVAHHSDAKASAAELQQCDVLVITHQAYVNAARNSRTATWERLTQWRGGRRLLTIIDEALANVVEASKVTADSLAKAIGYIPLHMRLAYPQEVKALEALYALLEALAKERTQSGVNPTKLLWDHAAIQPPEFRDLNGLREAMRGIQYEQLVLNEANSRQRLTIAKNVDETLQEAQAVMEHWAYYAKKGNEHSINSAAFLIPPFIPGPVVLDATANANFLWELFEGRSCIIPTPPNVRDYSNVTLHVARATGLGKHSMMKHAKTRVPRLLSALEQELGPDHSLLLVTHKAIKQLPLNLAHSFAHLDVGHWGAVDGRNDWANHDTVVIFGLSYRDPMWALSQFCAFQGPQDDAWIKKPKWKAHKDVLRLMGQRQLSVSIIQAIGRVRCRRVIDVHGRSLPTDIYIVLPKDGAGDAILRDIHSDMPGLKEVVWNFELDGPKVRKARKGSSHAELIAFMDNRLPGETSMPTVQRELGLSASKMKKLRETLRSTEHPTTQALLKLGVRYEARGTGRGAKSFLIKEPASSRS